MEWIKEEDQKPPYKKKVLMWYECPDCRDGVEHRHRPVARDYPNHGPVVGFYYQADRTYVESMIEQGRLEDAERWEKPHWIPQKPKYWAFIPTPYEEKEGN